MLTPYDWQEGVGHRAQYVDSRLQAGIPVVAVSVPDGVLIATFRYQSRKVFEIYDKIAYSAIGAQADIEAIRVAAIDFCHQEGFRRSEEDVTIRRVVTTISEPVKQAFGNFRSAPMVIKCLFAEIGDKPENDLFYVLDYDGDFGLRRGHAHLAGTTEAFDELKKNIEAFDFAKHSRNESVEHLRTALHGVLKSAEGASAVDLDLVRFEVGFLDRHAQGDRRFKLIEGSSVE